MARVARRGQPLAVTVHVNADAGALDAPIEGAVDAITTQFPDLRLMIAGQSAEQTALARRIAEGDAYVRAGDWTAATIEQAKALIELPLRERKIAKAERTRLVDDALKLVRETVDKFMQGGVTEAELKAAKQNIIGGFPLRKARSGSILAVERSSTYNCAPSLPPSAGAAFARRRAASPGLHGVRQGN